MATPVFDGAAEREIKACLELADLPDLVKTRYMMDALASSLIVQ